MNRLSGGTVWKPGIASQKLLEEDSWVQQGENLLEMSKAFFTRQSDSGR